MQNMDEATADFTAAVQAAYRAARKTYGDQRYQEGVRDGYQKGLKDSTRATPQTGGARVRTTFDLVKSQMGVGVQKLRNRRTPGQTVSDMMTTVQQPVERTVAESETGSPIAAAPTQLTTSDTAFEPASSLVEGLVDASEATLTAAEQEVSVEPTLTESTTETDSDSMLLEDLELEVSWSLPTLRKYFKNVDELCQVSDEETLGGLRGVGPKIVTDVVLALEKAGRKFGETSQSNS